MDPIRPDDEPDQEGDAVSPTPPSSGGETFVRSFSKDHGGLSRFKGRSLHHPFDAAARGPVEDEQSPQAHPQHQPPQQAEAPVSPKQEQQEQEDEDRDVPADFDDSDEDVAVEEDAENLYDDGNEEDSSHDHYQPENQTDDPDSPHSFAVDHLDHSNQLAEFQHLQRTRSVYRWIIRLFFLTAFLVLGFLMYRRIFGTPDSVAGPSASPLVNPVRNYRFRLPSKEWRIANRVPGRDVVLSRSGPTASLWIESGEIQAPRPLGSLADDMRAAWRKDVADMIEESTSTILVAGELAQRMVASGMVAGAHVRRAGLTFSHQGIWYRIAYQAPIELFGSVDDECAAAVSNYFRFIGDRCGQAESSGPDSSRFSGIAYEYSLEAPPGQWREAPELAVDSRFADLKLIDQSRSATLVVSPRPDATIDQLHSLYVRRQEKRFETAITFRDEEQLQIGGRPALRIRAYVEDKELGSKVFVVTFIEGEKIAYQIEAETLQDRAAEVLPDVAQAVESFQVEPASPKEAKKSPADDDRRKDNHFQKAPDFLQPK